LKIRKLTWCVLVMGALMASGGAFGQTPVHQPPAGMTCPGDKMVWVNTRSHVYHFKGERYFGSTKEGKFSCELGADKEGDRPANP
jgi:hypothetical protein